MACYRKITFHQCARSYCHNCLSTFLLFFSPLLNSVDAVFVLFYYFWQDKKVFFIVFAPSYVVMSSCTTHKFPFPPLLFSMCLCQAVDHRFKRIVHQQVLVVPPLNIHSFSIFVKSKNANKIMLRWFNYYIRIIYLLVKTAHTTIISNLWFINIML